MNSIKIKLLRNDNKYDCCGCGQNAELKVTVWLRLHRYNYNCCRSCKDNIINQVYKIWRKD